MFSANFVLICGASIILMSVFCASAMPICRALGLMDIPNARKHHAHPTPLVGGLALVLLILPLSLAAALLVAPTDVHRAVFIDLAAIALMAVIGMADDRHNLSANGRLALSLLVFFGAAFLDPLFNVRLLDFHVPKIVFGLWSDWVAYIFTMVCCVGLVNAINMADGKNGLVIGLLIGWLVALERFAPGAFLPLIVVAQCGLIVLFVFNLQGLMFLGDGGSYGFGCLISLLTIAIYNSKMPPGVPHLSADTIVLIFIVPVIDSFRLTVMRMRRGLSPMAADRDHLHHHLQNRFGWPAGLFVYLIIALAPAYLWIFLFYKV